MKGFFRMLSNKGWESLVHGNRTFSSGLAYGRSVGNRLGSRFAQSRIGGLGGELLESFKEGSFYRNSGQHIVQGIKGFGKYTNDYYSGPGIFPGIYNRAQTSLWKAGLRSGFSAQHSLSNANSILKRGRMAAGAATTYGSYALTKSILSDNNK